MARDGTLFDRSGLRPLLEKVRKKSAALVTKSDHASIISTHFKGNVRFSGPGPMFDQPLWLLAFTNRSGSNLLGEYLGHHPDLGGFGEVLNHTNVVRTSTAKSITSFPDYIGAIARPHHNRGRIFGVKVAWDQLQMLYRWRIDAMFPSVRLIHIKRDDTLDQAISFMIAQQTKQWTSKQIQAPVKDPDYDFDRIRKYIPRLNQANESIALTAASVGVPTHSVTYERLIADPQGTLDGVFDWGELAPYGMTLPEPRLKKQAAAMSEQFRQRFLADYRKSTGF